VAWKVTGPKLSEYYEKYYKSDTHPYFRAGSGIGKNRDDKDFSDNPRNSCVYVTFKDYYASPASQVSELSKVIEDTIEEVWDNFPDDVSSKEDIKVILVSHSIGGLVCRKYITEHPDDHQVYMLTTIDALNTGTPALQLRWAPYALDGIGIVGAVAFSNPWFLGFTAIGVTADLLLHRGGIRLLSPAAASLRPNSQFLKELNTLPLPTNIKYRAIISNSTAPLAKLSNATLGFKKGGDGAVPIESQSLKYAGIPNFLSLDYEEYTIDSPHFEAPSKAAPVVTKIVAGCDDI